MASPTIMLPFESRNPFEEYAGQYAVAATHASFDKDRKDLLHKLLLQESLAALPSFASITFNVEETTSGNYKPEGAKTGLGSSAAMTTAVVAALLHYLGVVNLALLSKDQKSKNEATLDLDLVHVIAQIAHCIAQGKVGSGFYVSSAVYRSQRYVCFSQEVIYSAQDMVQGNTFEEVVDDVLNA